MKKPTKTTKKVKEDLPTLKLKPNDYIIFSGGLKIENTSERDLTVTGKVVITYSLDK